MGKYENLGRFLTHLLENHVNLPMEKIEEILGFPLPTSSIKFRPWWANDRTHVQASDGWMKFGWTVETVDFTGRTVTFSKKDNIPVQEPRKTHSVEPREMNPIRFEEVARATMSVYFKKELSPRKLQGFPKLFDLVSSDGTIIGDAKYLTMVGGTSIPPAKFATIAEYVWLLEKLSAKKKFLVFGNDKRVPEEWLKRYGMLVTDVEFYFIDENQNMIKLDRTVKNG